MPQIKQRNVKNVNGDFPPKVSHRAVCSNNVTQYFSLFIGTIIKALKKKFYFLLRFLFHIYLKLKAGRTRSRLMTIPGGLLTPKKCFNSSDIVSYPYSTSQPGFRF